MKKDTKASKQSGITLTQLYGYFKHIDTEMLGDLPLHEWEEQEARRRHEWRVHDSEKLEGRSKDEQIELMRAERDKWRLAAMDSETTLSRNTASLNRFAAIADLMVLAGAAFQEGTSNVFGVVDESQYVSATALLMRDAIVETFCHDEDKYRDARQLKALLEMEGYCRPFMNGRSSLMGGISNYVKWWEHRGPNGDQRIEEVNKAKQKSDKE